MRVAEGLCAAEHRLVNVLEKTRRLRRHIADRGLDLLPRVAADEDAGSLLHILRADLHTDREAAHLLIRKLVARRAVGVIKLHADLRLLKRLGNAAGRFEHALRLLADRNHDDLRRRHLRRKNEPVVVTVDHDDRTDHPGRHSP